MTLSNTVQLTRGDLLKYITEKYVVTIVALDSAKHICFMADFSSPDLDSNANLTHFLRISKSNKPYTCHIDDATKEIDIYVSIEL